MERRQDRYEQSDKSEHEFRRLTMITSVPWNKMFKREFILDIGARFESVPLGNDAWFNKFAGSKAKKAAVINERLYYYVKYNNNTTYKKRPFDDYYIIIDSNIRRHKLLKQYDLLGTVRVFGFYPKNVKRDFGYWGYLKLVLYSIIHDPTIIFILLSKLKNVIK